MFWMKVIQDEVFKSFYYFFYLPSANSESIKCIGKETIHQIYGTRIAVLAGDYMFAQSSWYLANLENLDVIKLISQVWTLSLNSIF